MTKKPLRQDAKLTQQLTLIMAFEEHFNELVEQGLIPAQSYQMYIERAIRTAKHIATEIK